ncbi:MAG: hypothetical protein IJA02_08835 [Clostridia bacterium]|nr:hypothetical protein [Clostridia bacterium]
MSSKLKPCPKCGEEMSIEYACGEYFVLPTNRGCYFCDGFNEMHSSEEQEIEAWNRRADNG